VTRRLKWYEHADGVHRVCVQVQHPLTFDELAMVLARAEAAGEQVADLTTVELRELVKRSLRALGDTATEHDEDLLRTSHVAAARRAFGDPPTDDAGMETG
jgi:hypothetical protein